MMKRLAYMMLCLLLSTSYGWAQSGMTDNQVMDYVIEQNAKAALDISDYAYVMETGVITMAGPGKALLNDPRVQQAYLGE